MKEERIQYEAVMWLQSEGYFFFSVPNEATQGKISKYVAMGMRPGAADLVVVLPLGKVLFVEFKNEVGKQRKAQELFQKRVEELGHRYVLIRSVEELKEALK